MHVGIDLGATNSVIAVKGQVKLVDGYPPPVYLPDCDVSIIPAPDGDLKVPSALWIHPSRPDLILVGKQAKRKALEGEAPIMFWRRSIGTDESLKIHDRSFTAREVATHILKHLRESAERALGQPVGSATVTCPADFRPVQVQEIREAAKAAGLEIARIVTDPEAAALACTLGMEHRPLKLMAYDLGGSTFSATVLEKAGDLITIKANAGDQLLGGYNFDRALAKWILDRLSEKAARPSCDVNTPEGRRSLARLLQLSEQVKVSLSKGSSEQVPVEMHAQNVVVDSQGRAIPIQEQIGREQFTDLIRPYLDETVDYCKHALASAAIQAQDLDALLLVGGSSHGPWVQDTIKKAFGIDAWLNHPDLCTAVGAALSAAEPPILAQSDEIDAGSNAPCCAVSALETDRNHCPPDLAELRLQYEELEARRQELEAFAGESRQVLLEGKARDISEKLRKLLAEEVPERGEICTWIDELRRIVPAYGQMEPPSSRFRRLLEDCRHMLAKAQGDSALSLRALLERIEVGGTEAYRSGDRRKWVQANQELERLFLLASHIEANICYSTIALPRPIKSKVGIDLGTSYSSALPSDPNARPGLAHSGGTPEMPSATMDPVHFSVTSPPVVLPGSVFALDVWAHLDRQRQRVLKRAREHAMGAAVQIQSKGPVKVARGTALTVSLRVADLTVDPVESAIEWLGEIGNTRFSLSVPSSAPEGPRAGVARFHIGEFEVARLDFVLQVGQCLAAWESLPTREKRYRTAFASYADEDRDAVLGRIQGIHKVLPSLDVFLAAAQLRAGEHWRERLREEIVRREVMYLFWSKAASQSHWVDWEWRTGVQLHDIDFVDPCPLVSPDEVPPPKELADELHFNDWTLAWRRRDLRRPLKR
jgi:Ethanolamine utilization protein EutJ (predicted chaperonin)